MEIFFFCTKTRPKYWIRSWSRYLPPSFPRPSATSCAASACGLHTVHCAPVSSPQLQKLRQKILAATVLSPLPPSSAHARYTPITHKTHAIHFGAMVAICLRAEGTLSTRISVSQPYPRSTNSWIRVQPCGSGCTRSFQRKFESSTSCHHRVRRMLKRLGSPRSLCSLRSRNIHL